MKIYVHVSRWVFLGDPCWSIVMIQLTKSHRFATLTLYNNTTVFWLTYLDSTQIFMNDVHMYIFDKDYVVSLAFLTTLMLSHAHDGFYIDS